MTSDSFDLPPYTYIPGRTPHPVSDPRGHSYRMPEETSLSLEQMIARGSFLFEHGFYWEAHEAWEQAWIQLGRTGTKANQIKGVIKLAASGVKCLEENLIGAQRHYQRAKELLVLEKSKADPQLPLDSKEVEKFMENILQAMGMLQSQMGSTES